MRRRRRRRRRNGRDGRGGRERRRLVAQATQRCRVVDVDVGVGVLEGERGRGHGARGLVAPLANEDRLRAARRRLDRTHDAQLVVGQCRRRLDEIILKKKEEANTFCYQNVSNSTSNTTS